MRKDMLRNLDVPHVDVPRAALALLLVASLVPLANFATGSPTVAVAEAADSAAQPATAESASAAGAATVEDKEEVVYALLNSEGTTRSAYVVNHFQIEQGGELVDYGDYSSATNLSTTEVVSSSDARTSVAVEPGDFYYEGVLNSVELPWLVSVAYTLDDREVEPQELAGASGLLGIHIKTEKSAAADPVFFENYLLQIQLTLDTARARNIHAPEATVASAGENRQVAFMVLPGKEGDLTLTVQVTDFEMPGIQVSALPFSMVFDIPDTASMVDDMATLTDAIEELDEGVGKLKSGAADIKNGAADLASGSDSLDDGLSLLSKNSTSLTSASLQIDGALQTIAKQLGADVVDPAQLKQLIEGLRQLSTGLYSGDVSQPGLAEGLAQTQGGITQATTTMDGSIASLTPVGQQAIQNLYADSAFSGLSQSSQDTIDDLVDTNTQAAYVRGAWYGQSGNDGVKSGLETAAAGLGQSAGSCQYMAGQLSAIADGLESELSEIAQLQTLATYMDELSRNYTSFNTGLVSYADGIDTLATNYQTFNKGLTRFASGTDEFYGGVSALRDGTFELYVNVEDLPETLRDEIDSFIKDYQAADFTPTSFTSAKNEHLSRVQFILLTDAIKKPAATDDVATVEPTTLSFWDRLVALFS
ncbi:MAG: hypothetical protein LBL27_00210 [Coriobacteriales bacterium]|jgi:X-X-X-Leu-X-X-Gly heptad repeat protein|nr:hypothetical protein [Coriobacteriales bacterium]